MDLTGLVVFAAALAVAAASPGPTITALVARVLVRGTSGRARLHARALDRRARVADCRGSRARLHRQDLCLRLHGAEICRRRVSRLPRLAHVDRAGACRLTRRRRRRSTRHGCSLPAVSLTLGNPKIMVFYLALLPNLIDLNAVDRARLCGAGRGDAGRADGWSTAPMCCLPRAPAGCSRAPARSALVNRGSGALLMGAAVAVATR